MSSLAQKLAAKRNVRLAQLAWQKMNHRQHARAQPEGRKRAKPGEKGTGDYYRVVLRPKKEFVSFRIHDVGRKGHAQRLAGKRASGSWDTQAWLINKNDAHVESGHLIGDNPNARKILDQLSSAPRHIRGDVFEAKDRKNIPEKEKPTAAQRRAQRRNIKKAQSARHKK